MANLDEAILLAVKAHHGQKDKAGEPYILHPLRLMFRQNSEAARIVAMLHDVVEDTAVTMEQLRDAGFSQEILDAVTLLTHDPQYSYEEYVARLKTNPLARSVKLADLEDNMRMERVAELTEREWARLQRYHRAWRELRAADKLT